MLPAFLALTIGVGTVPVSTTGEPEVGLQAVLVRRGMTEDEVNFALREEPELVRAFGLRRWWTNYYPRAGLEVRFAFDRVSGVKRSKE
jgi:hypothetical protein